MATSTSDAVILKALSSASGRNAVVLGLLGAMLIAPLAFIGLAFAASAASTAAPVEASGGELQTKRSAWVLLGVLAGVAAGGAALIVVAVRRSGPRGTRVGRALLDSPEEIFGVRTIERQIRVSGVPVRTVHVVSVSIDRGDELELHVRPDELQPLLAALKEKTGGKIGI